MMHRVTSGLASRGVMILNWVANRLTHRGMIILNGVAHGMTYRVTHGATTGMAGIHLFPVIVIEIAGRSTHRAAEGAAIHGTADWPARWTAGHMATAAPIIVVPVAAAFDVLAAQRNPSRQQTQRQQSQKLPIHDLYSQYEKRELGLPWTWSEKCPKKTPDP